MLHRGHILEKLSNYSPFDENERNMWLETIEFVKANPNCFERTLKIGHVTGSAWILNPDKTMVLMTHHAKFNRWMQLGGHSDGDHDTLNVALREAHEESGLKNIVTLSDQIFDIDAHTVEARGDEPEHKHYDIRFLFQADPNEKFVVSHESKDLAWKTFDEITQLCAERESIMRMVKKSRRILAVGS